MSSYDNTGSRFFPQNRFTNNDDKIGNVPSRQGLSSVLQQRSFGNVSTVSTTDKLSANVVTVDEGAVIVVSLFLF